MTDRAPSQPHLPTHVHDDDEVPVEPQDMGALIREVVETKATVSKLAETSNSAFSNVYNLIHHLEEDYRAATGTMQNLATNLLNQRTDIQSIRTDVQSIRDLVTMMPSPQAITQAIMEAQAIQAKETRRNDEQDAKLTKLGKGVGLMSAGGLVYKLLELAYEAAKLYLKSGL